MIASTAKETHAVSQPTIVVSGVAPVVVGDEGMRAVVAVVSAARKAKRRYPYSLVDSHFVLGASLWQRFCYSRVVKMQREP